MVFVTFVDVHVTVGVNVYVVFVAFTVWPRAVASAMLSCSCRNCNSQCL